MKSPSAGSRSAIEPLPHIRDLDPYVPGEQPPGTGWVKLNTNENPFPPSPRVEAAVTAEVGNLPRYPQPVSAPLRHALARQHKVLPEQVIVGNGSDEILNLLIRAYCDRDRPAGYMVPSYSLYPVLAAAHGVPVREVSFAREMVLETEKILETGAPVFFLTSPNAPTGISFRTSELAKLAEAYPGLLVIDEAYVAYAEEDARPLLGAYPNVVIVRTFSKSHSLAGLRVGYALAHPEVIVALDKIRDSYNVNRLSQAGALAALEDSGYTKAILGKIVRIRDYHFHDFTTRGWFTYPSQANFLFTEPIDRDGQAGPEVAAHVFDFLKSRKILVRRFPKLPQTASFLRISIGTEEEMLSLTDALDEWPATAG